MMLMVTMMPTKLMRKGLQGDSDEQKKVTCNWVSRALLGLTMLSVMQSITSYIASHCK